MVTHGIFGWQGLPELVPLVEALVARGHAVLTWDVRGHGESGGRFHFGRRSWKDLLALTGQVQSETGAGVVSAVGFSFGAFHTLLAQADAAPFDRIVWVAGPKDFGGLHRAVFSGSVSATLPYRRQRPLKGARLGLPTGGPAIKPVAVAEKVDVPVVLIHGTKDWIVPVDHSQTMAERLAGETELHVLEGGLHAEYLLAQMPETVVPLILDGLD